ncbi:MAG TPA: DEAD/DEAH box helicase, partial [Brevibacterium ravenspurgense]|nr:DEAD/DEAH box helicase [Brevibacterium ravenspurgense]
TDTVVATGTSSGKSLTFLVPILDSIARTRDSIRPATSIYLAPTKALSHDQLTAAKNLPLQGLRPAAFDGDASREQKDWARRWANLLFTNPDMLHRSVLPAHARYARWFKSLRFIVVDEAHRYRGVFGSHVALVLRRLLRIAEHYGAQPVVIGASATMSEPAATFARLTGRPAAAITEDCSPRAAGEFILWEPPLLPGSDDGSLELPADAARRSTIAEAADMLTDTTCAGYRSIAFIASRKGTEALASAIRQEVETIAPELAKTVAAYRGGYLPEERRMLETALRTGKLRTVASTNALELGIDISGLDVVVMAGWPGTLAALWQQAGRAGRSGQQWSAVLIARDDPLDTYVVHHPEAIFDTPVDAGVINPANPYVLAGHLLAAAAELPLTNADFPRFDAHTHPSAQHSTPDHPEQTEEPGGASSSQAAQLVAQLTEHGMLRARPTGWFWTKTESAAALTDIRGSGGGQVRLVEHETGQLLGTVDDASAHTQTHTGAIYVHQGIEYQVMDLDFANSLAMVQQVSVDFTTQAQSTTEISIVETHDQFALPSGVRVFSGMVDVTDQVTSFVRKQKRTGVRLGEFELDLPARTLQTSAVWWTAPEGLIADAEVEAADLPGAVHAAEHCAIGLLPLFAGCDRWDIGGVSSDRHADTGMATVFVHDGQPGGAGFAERGFAEFRRWWQSTLDTLTSCECVSGCPSCVQSPKCGNGNEPLDKDAARRLLQQMLG